MLSLPKAWVQPLVRELGSCKAHSTAKKKGGGSENWTRLPEYRHHGRHGYYTSLCMIWSPKASNDRYHASVCDRLFSPQNTPLVAPSGTRRHCLTPPRPVALIHQPWKNRLAVSSKVAADQLTPKDIVQSPVLPRAPPRGLILGHGALAFPGLRWAGPGRGTQQEVWFLSDKRVIKILVELCTGTRICYHHM